ncbi:hypothetical protein BJ165DRAFT_1532414 [Panaeolus papilionaceus]|nr:hypothetical protein BJ165DRAFT_1532414 [Panaeolus papilionaceus]
MPKDSYPCPVSSQHDNTSINSNSSSLPACAPIARPSWVSPYSIEASNTCTNLNPQIPSVHANSSIRPSTTPGLLTPNTTTISQPSYMSPFVSRSFLSTAPGLVIASQEPSQQSQPNHTSFTHFKKFKPAPAHRSESSSDIVTSVFCPNISSGDWLTAWTTPFSLKCCEEASLGAIPKHIVDKSYALVFEALEKNSRTSYGAGILCFTQFCDSIPVDESSHMPASVDLITSFVAHHVGHVSGSTVKTWLSGVRAWHIVNKAPWNDDKFLSMVCTTANKLGSSKKCPPCTPISLEHLKLLHNHLDISKPHDAAIWACALTTFFGCRRLGETTVSEAPFNADRHVSRSSKFQIHQDGQDDNLSMSFHIPWTKTTKEHGGNIIFTCHLDILCPVKAFMNHIKVNPLMAPFAGAANLSKHSLFAYCVPSGAAKDMYKSKFLSVVQGIWKTDPSLVCMSGHSFCIGGAIALLLAGVEPEVVAAARGWTSLTFLLYWRKLEHVIPNFTSCAYSKENLDFIKSKLVRFQGDIGVSSEFSQTVSSLLL